MKESNHVYALFVKELHDFDILCDELYSLHSCPHDANLAKEEYILRNYASVEDCGEPFVKRLPVH